VIGRSLAILAAVCALTTTAAAQKTDIVTLDNGDVLTCDIKDLRRGKLRVKTDSMDTVYVDWIHVAQLESRSLFQVQLATGEYRFGALARSETPRVLRLVSPRAFADTPMDQIALLDPIDSTVRSRISGSVSVGYNYTKASDVGQLNFRLNPRYRTRKYLLELDFSTVDTVDGQAGTTRRQSYLGKYTHFLAKRWFFYGETGYESNDELGLDQRTFVSGGIGRYVHQTNHSAGQVLAGLALNHEDYDMGTGQDNFEGVLRGAYSVFDFDTPVKDISLDLTAYPNFTDSGRWRITSNARVRWELVKDLTLDLTFYGDYDSGSDQSGASTIDYGIVTSVGYSL
jgi:hypothetical protein